jgi:hypothetical protein
MEKHADDELDAVQEHDEEHPGEEHHKHHGGEIVHKLEEGWHHLEDLTGGRAHVELAGEDQQSNFEHIEDHQSAREH